MCNASVVVAAVVEVSGKGGPCSAEERQEAGPLDKA